MAVVARYGSMVVPSHCSIQRTTMRSTSACPARSPAAMPSAMISAAASVPANRRWWPAVAPRGHSAAAASSASAGRYSAVSGGIMDAAMTQSST